MMLLHLRTQMWPILMYLKSIWSWKPSLGKRKGSGVGRNTLWCLLSQPYFYLRAPHRSCPLVWNAFPQKSSKHFLSSLLKYHCSAMRSVPVVSRPALPGTLTSCSCSAFLHSTSFDYLSNSLPAIPLPTSMEASWVSDFVFFVYSCTNTA